MNSLLEFKKIISFFIFFSISVLLYLYITGLKNSIEQLKLDYLKAQKESVVKELEVQRLKSSLSEQSRAVEFLKKDVETSMKKLKEWRAKKPKIRYIKTPTIIREIQSNECKDIKNSINAVRSINFNEL